MPEKNPLHLPTLPFVLRSYLTLAFRHLGRNKVFSSINILGLSLGMASVVLIVLHVRNELSYDRHHAHAADVYRVVQEQRFANGIQHLATTTGPLAPALRREYPDVSEATRVHVRRGLLVSTGQKSLGGQTIAYADANLFDVFSFPFVRGDPATALGQPHSLVLTQTTARAFFAEEDPVGKTVRFNSGNPYLITGVIADPPAQSHFHFSALASLSTFTPTPEWLKNYVSAVYTYLRLRPGVSAWAFEQKLIPFGRKFRGKSGKEDNSGRVLYHLQPLVDIHLRSDLVEEIEPNGNATAVYAFGLVAAVILLLAGVNYVILATASYTQRLKEVGLRQTLGAHRTQLMAQFWLESVGVTVLGFGLALGWVIVALPAFNQLTRQRFTWEDLVGWPELGSGLALLVGVSALASAYPAWYVSRRGAVETLKGVRTAGRGGFGLRDALVTFQFAISIALVVATSVVYQQLDYVQRKPLGFNQQLLVNLKVLNQSDRPGKMALLKQELRGMPGVTNAAASLNAVGEELEVSDVRLANGPPGDNHILRILVVDYDYFSTLELQMSAGRPFSRQFAGDTTQAFIVNEAAVRQFGWASPREALGKELEYLGGGRFREREPVIGVVRDFHYASLHQEIQPLLIMCWPSIAQTLNVRIGSEAGNLSEGLAGLESAWRKVFPGQPFAYTFADESLAGLYQSDQQARQLLLVFAGLALAIAGLGLFGLATFTAQRRTREIGIRKVLGASVSDLVALLSKDFLRLVLIAFAVATPLAWYGMNRWLRDFAYRIDLTWGAFALAGGAALLISLLAVSATAAKAATANPVKSLRTK
ncbi:MAG: ABC transporter permease [Ferruginibacter sp.]|nr:ABC transporter permease [Cytophagales bacterium]